MIPTAYCKLFHNPTLIKNVLLGLVVSCTLLALLWQARRYEISQSADRFILISLLFYLAVNVVSVLVNLTPADLGLSYLIELAVMIFCFFVYVYCARDISNKIFLRANGAGCFGVLCFGMISILKEHTKPISTFGNPNFFGAYLIAVWPLLLLLLKDSKVLFRCLAGISLLLFFVNIYFIRSWAVWLTFVISFFFIIPCYIQKRKLALGLVLSYCALLFLAFRIAPIEESLVKQISNDVRPYLYRGTIHLIRENFYLGCGAGQFLLFYPHYRLPEYFTHPLSVDTTDHAHCELLEIFAETGFLGLLGFLAFLFLIVYIALKSVLKADRERRLQVYTCFMGAFFLLFENLWDVNLRYLSSQFIFWSFLGWGYGLATRSRDLREISFQRPHLILRWVGGVLILCFFGFFYLRPLAADYFFKKAVIERNAENYPSAARFYARSLQISPRQLEVLYRLSYLYNLMGDNPKAAETYEKVLRLAPLYSSAHGNLGAIYARLGDLDKAYEHLSIQYALNPYDPDQIATLASVLLRMGRFEEAKNYLRRTLRLNPKHEFVLKVLKELRKNRP